MIKEKKVEKWWLKSGNNEKKKKKKRLWDLMPTLIWNLSYICKCKSGNLRLDRRREIRVVSPERLWITVTSCLFRQEFNRLFNRILWGTLKRIFYGTKIINVKSQKLGSTLDLADQQLCIQKSFWHENSFFFILHQKYIYIQYSHKSSFHEFRSCAF